MSPDEELIVIFGALHLIALALGAILFVMFLRADTVDGIPPPEDDESGGGGGNDRVSPPPRTSPPGGIPLLDAEPSSTRLRSHGDRLRRQRERRTVGPPARARHTPARPRTTRPPPCGSAARRELLRLGVPAVDVRPRGLARPRPVDQQPLLEQRR